MGVELLSPSARCEHLRKHACALLLAIILVDESQKYKKVDMVDTVTSTCDRDRSVQLTREVNIVLYTNCLKDCRLTGLSLRFQVAGYLL